jgi:hypothetical protein
LRRARIDERLHVRKGVEEKMRRDLRLQQAESRVERFPLELTALECKGQLLIARERVLLPDNRDERGPWREEEADERQMRPPAHAGGLLPERHCPLRRGQNVDQHRRHRHEHTDSNDLQCPSLEPCRQSAWPYLEECERRRRRQAESDGSEEERGEGISPSRQHQEPDADRHRQGDGRTPCCFHNDAIELPAFSRHWTTLTPFTVGHSKR